MKINWNNINKFIEKLLFYSGALFALISLITLISRFFNWGSNGLFKYLQSNIVTLWLFTLTIFIIIILIWIFTLYKRYIRGFKDNFHINLNENWDYKGEWRVVDNTLIVTKSGDGGLCKKGALWENYSLSFKAKIIKDCIGVIVRAQDLNNYYMFQIRKDCIRPHRRASVPEIEGNKINENKEGSDEIANSLQIKYKTGWEKYDNLRVDLEPALENWFKVKIKVYGESIIIYINDIMVFQQEHFLKIL